MALIQVSGMSVFAQADIESLAVPAETIVTNVLGFLPSLDGQRRLALAFTVVDGTGGLHPVVVNLDYRDESFENLPLVGVGRGEA